MRSSNSDLRNLIEILDDSNELRRVKKRVDWNLEIGAITRRLIDIRGPAVLFENIRGYRGQRMLGLPFGPSRPLHSRLSLALGLPKNSRPLGIVDYVSKKIANPINSRMVDDSPCKENVLKCESVDVTRFPAPFIHRMDGGRYLGTWCIVVTKDPEARWTNWGVYRVMLHDSRTLIVNFNPSGQHGGEMLARHQGKNPNKPYQAAIVIGADPFSLIAAATSSPKGMSEASIAGSLKGSPIELVKCETVDLEVPASAEIVIEGMVRANDTMLEGPMGEFTGYSSGGTRPKPCLRISCICYRNNPIVTFANMGKPWDDFAVVSSIMYAANIKTVLQKANLPVKDVFTWPVETAVISVTKSESNLARRIMKALRSANCRTGMIYTLLVGQDVDVTNLEDIFWCLITRLHPRNGINVESHKGGSALIPLLTPEERRGHYSSTAFLDCTWPSSWTDAYLNEHCQVVDFYNAWPKRVREKVRNNWQKYGLASEADDWGTSDRINP